MTYNDPFQKKNTKSKNSEAFLHKSMCKKIFHLHHWFFVLSASEETYSEPRFKKITQLKIGHKNHKVLFQGITNLLKKNLYAGIQIERKKSGNMYTGEYTGFTQFDDGVLSLFSTFIGVKLAQLEESSKVRQQEKKYFTFISCMESLLSIKTYIHLIVEMSEQLPAIVEFELVGIYYYEPTSDELCTCLKSQFLDGTNSLLRYSSSFGITGSVLKSGKAFSSKKGKYEKGFHEIDNIAMFIRQKQNNYEC